jgi:hypothetical protein
MPRPRMHVVARPVNQSDSLVKSACRRRQRSDGALGWLPDAGLWQEAGGAGWVAERFKAPVLKTGVRATAPWVRIPPHPPVITNIALYWFKIFASLL